MIGLCFFVFTLGNWLDDNGLGELNVFTVLAVIINIVCLIFKVINLAHEYSVMNNIVKFFSYMLNN